MSKILLTGPPGKSACLLLLVFLAATPRDRGASEAAPQIRFSYLEERIPEAGMIQKTRVTIGALSVVCQPPNSWRAETDEENSRVQFRSLPLGAGISVTLLPKAPRAISPKDLRARLAREYNDINIIDEYKAYTAGPEGTAFELRQTVSSKFTNHLIVLYIPLEQNMMELKLAAPEETFEQCRSFWPQFLNSFKVEPAPALARSVSR